MHYITAKSILTTGFSSQKNGMNLYRGCQHSCIYCDSRSKCYNFDHSFEDIAVKENALTLLESALSKKRRACMIGTGSMTDPYMPLENELFYTRKSLEIIEKYGFGATLITKSDLVMRDIDILKRINDKTKCVIQMTLTTYDDELCGKIEPNVSNTSARFNALLKLRDAGIPTVVWLCPILPFINDTEKNIGGILDMCFEAQVKGIICFGMGMTLREGSREYFYKNLDRHFPGLKAKYIKTFGSSYMCNSPRSGRLMRLFHDACERAGVMHSNDKIFRYIDRFEQKENEQLSLF